MKLVIDENQCYLIDRFSSIIYVIDNHWQLIITKTCAINCPSITNINQLIDIDCHRLSLIIDFINWLGPGVSCDQAVRVFSFCLANQSCVESEAKKLRVMYKSLPNTLCSSRKYPCTPTGFFILHPPFPLGNSSFASYFASKILTFKSPLPLGISEDLPWGGYGFFLELHIIID